jgi:hypothetical protein
MLFVVIIAVVLTIKTGLPGGMFAMGSVARSAPLHRVVLVAVNPVTAA